MSREVELAKAIQQWHIGGLGFNDRITLAKKIDGMITDILDSTPQSLPKTEKFTCPYCSREFMVMQIDRSAPQPASDVVEMRAAIKEHIPLWLEKTFSRYADIIQSCQDRLQKLRIVEVELNEQNTALRGKLHVTQAKLEAAERRVAELEAEVQGADANHAEAMDRWRAESQIKPAKVEGDTLDELGKLLFVLRYGDYSYSWEQQTNDIRHSYRGFAERLIAAYERSRATEGNDADQA